MQIHPELPPLSRITKLALYDGSVQGHSRLPAESISIFQKLRPPCTLKRPELERMAFDHEVPLEALLACTYTLCLGHFYYT